MDRQWKRTNKAIEKQPAEDIPDLVLTGDCTVTGQRFIEQAFVNCKIVIVKILYFVVWVDIGQVSRLFATSNY